MPTKKLKLEWGDWEPNAEERKNIVDMFREQFPNAQKEIDELKAELEMCFGEQ